MSYLIWITIVCAPFAILPCINDYGLTVNLFLLVCGLITAITMLMASDD